MTQKLFWPDPYLTRLDAQVTGVNGDEITLDRTIFFAFSGGQESDAGTIGGRRVLQARKDDAEIVYTLEAGHGLRSGDPVTIQIDWDRRYKLMRLHFAAEIVLELAYRRLPGVQKVGAHIAADKARIDFEWGDNLTSLLPAIEQEAQAIFAADQPITSAFSDEAAEQRYWEVSGFARVACGGTHLKRTGEVGAIRLKRQNPGRGKERIEIILGDGVVPR